MNFFNILFCFLAAIGTPAFAAALAATTTAAALAASSETAAAAAADTIAAPAAAAGPAPDPAPAATVTLPATDNTVTFVSLDAIDRTVFFTETRARPMPAIAPVKVPAGATVAATCPPNWEGMFWAVWEGRPDAEQGVLGEVLFQGDGGKTFVDVSAIDNRTARSGVQTMRPVGQEGDANFSGCAADFDPAVCHTAYYLPDDVQTKVTSSTHLVVALGRPGLVDAAKQPSGGAAVEKLRHKRRKLERRKLEHRNASRRG